MTIVDGDVRQRSTVQLVKDLTHHATTLVHQEIELVKVELNENLELAKAELAEKKAGAGVAVFTAAGVAGLLAPGNVHGIPRPRTRRCDAQLGGSAVYCRTMEPRGCASCDVWPQQDPGSGHARAR